MGFDLWLYRKETDCPFRKIPLILNKKIVQNGHFFGTLVTTLLDKTLIFQGFPDLSLSEYMREKEKENLIQLKCV